LGQFKWYWYSVFFKPSWQSFHFRLS
jgi:hypothetical protein